MIAQLECWEKMFWNMYGSYVEIWESLVSLKGWVMNVGNIDRYRRCGAQYYILKKKVILQSFVWMVYLLSCNLTIHETIGYETDFHKIKQLTRLICHKIKQLTTHKVDRLFILFSILTFLL